MNFNSPKKGDILKGTLSEYRVESTNAIGKGGNGYVAPVISNSRKLAAKVYKETLKNSKRKNRFIAECEILEHLRHPHITPIIDRGEWQGRPFYIMPRAEYSLDKIIPAIQSMPNEYKLLARGVTDALVEFHSNKVEGDGCWHRDIKPSNILWFQDIYNDRKVLIPKLSDFGIAHICPSFIDIELETTQRMMSHDCFAPEQREGLPGDQRSDIFSWGFVLWWAATGVWPRGSGAKPSQCISTILDDYFDMILEKALAVDPRNRFNSMKKLGEAIKSYFDDLPKLQSKWNLGNWSIDGVITTPQEVSSLGISSICSIDGKVNIVESRGMFTYRGKPLTSQSVAQAILVNRQNIIKNCLRLI